MSYTNYHLVGLLFLSLSIFVGGYIADRSRLSLRVPITIFLCVWTIIVITASVLASIHDEDFKYISHTEFCEYNLIVPPCAIITIFIIHRIITIFMRRK